MPAMLTVAEMLDLTKGTQRDLGKLKFQQIAQNVTSYVIFKGLFKKGRVTFDDGYGIQKNLMVTLQSVAEHAGLRHVYSLRIDDLMAQINIDWAHAHTYYGWESRELMMNKGQAVVFKIIKPRRVNATLDMAKLIETAFWGAVRAVADTHIPNTVSYYVVTNATTGFNGGLPGSHTTVAGINPTTTTAWKNYTFQYVNTSKADLIKKTKIALMEMDWQSPVDIDDYRMGNGQKFKFFTNKDIIVDLEDLGEAQNENIGKDLMAFDAKTQYGGTGGTDLSHIDSTLVLRRHPVHYVPQLNSDTTDPFFGLDMSSFYAVCLKDDYLRERDPMVVGGDQPDSWVVHITLSYNFLCVDRRRNMVGYK